MVSLKETRAGVPDGRNEGHTFVPYSEKPSPKPESRVFTSKTLEEELGFNLSSFA